MERFLRCGIMFFFSFYSSLYVITGLISLSGNFFPLDVYAWVAVFVIPVNAALNPFLYTFNNIKEKSVNKSVQFQNNKEKQVGSFPRS